MRSTLANLRSPAIIGLVLMLPFALLELVHNKVNSRDAPGLAVLFGLLWILPVAFIAIVMPIARSVRTGDRVLARPIHLMLRLASLVFIAWAWAAMFIDQLPCFLGVPNCD